VADNTAQLVAGDSVAGWKQPIWWLVTQPVWWLVIQPLVASC